MLFRVMKKHRNSDEHPVSITVYAVERSKHISDITLLLIYKDKEFVWVDSIQYAPVPIDK